MGQQWSNIEKPLAPRSHSWFTPLAAAPQAGVTLMDGPRPDSPRIPALSTIAPTVAPASDERDPLEPMVGLIERADDCYPCLLGMATSLLDNAVPAHPAASPLGSSGLRLCTTKP